MRFSSRLFVLFGLALALAPVVGVLASAGCSGRETFDCPDVYDPNRKDPQGNPDPCCERTEPCPPPGSPKDAGADASADASDGGPPSGSICSGTCVPLPGATWAGPLLVAVAPSGSSTICPPGAVSADLDGYHTDLDAGAPPTCGSCSCAPSLGSCAPPTSITASESPCVDGGGGWSQPFDPPPAWDGTCTSAHALGPTTCPTCTHSITVDPLSPVGSCPPITTGAGGGNVAAFASDVLACAAAAEPTCGDLVHLCAVAAAGFRQCIYAAGNVACPSAWPDRIAAATGVDDTRSCSPCTCSAAEGDSCTGALAIYNDSACTAVQLVAGIASDKADCFDVSPAGAALGSKAVLNPKYTPGSCTAGGGELGGSVSPKGLATFCCLSE